MHDPQVLVVGAGPTGLVLALWLARSGVQVRVVDKAEGPGEASRAVAVQARTLELYDQLGFAPEVVEGGIAVRAAHLREAGRDVATFAIGEIGAGLSPYPIVLSYPQDDHERFLLGKLAELGVRVDWGVALRSLSQEEDGVEAVLDRGGQEERCRAAYLCGCDGAHSAVRQALGIAFPGGTYDQLFYVADVHAEGAFDPDLVLNLGPGSLGLSLPVRSRSAQRWIGLVPPTLSDRDHVTFDDIRPEVERLLGRRAKTVNWFSTYRVHHRVAERFRAGRCFIAGDAGHIHSPAGGQGMNTGIGDAANLAWKLTEVVSGRAAPSLLDTYEPERIAFARRLVATTDSVFSLMIAGGVRGRLIRTVLAPGLAPLAARLAPLRRLMFRTVSQTRIHYRESALSAGRGGSVRGGDRLPWLASSEGGNFAPLRSLGWQLHVYGQVAPKLSQAAAALQLPRHEFPWSDGAAAAGFERGAGYLVRPDGYVSLALPDNGAEELTRFAAQWGLTFGRAAPLASTAA